MNSETLSNAANSAKEYGQQAVDTAKQYGQTAVDTAKQYGQQAGEIASNVGQQAAMYGKSLKTTAASIPVEAYLLGALGSIGISLSLKLLGRDRDAEFVGHWAPTFLTLGLLSKLIRHDEQTTHTPARSGGGGRRR